jgi:two-component system copper resistance phosphate regulon response regulator CusR
MRLLIIEDEIKTATYLVDGLKSSGYIANFATDGEGGLFLAKEYRYDLIILDVMLPTLDGWTVLTELRRLQPEVRILMLTARDSINDKLKGFDLGADDYLVKPFAFSELLSRVRALLRREVKPRADKIQLADLEIDLIKHKVRRGLRPIHLTAQEFSLLVYLAEHPGEVLSRTLIAEAVWDINFNTDTNIVDVAIRRLRQKIDADFQVKLIHTLRGIGYVIEAR